jgi:hypothetical protein
LRERWGMGERSRRLCLSLSRWRFLSLAPSLSLSWERSRLLSLERSRFLSPDLPRFLSRDVSRRLSLDRSFRRSLEASRFLSLDEPRDFLYGSGDCSPLRRALGSTVVSFGSRAFGTFSGFLSLDLLLDRRPDAIEGSFATPCAPFLDNRLGLPFLLATVGGEAVLPWTICCVSSRRAL